MANTKRYCEQLRARTGRTQWQLRQMVRTCEVCQQTFKGSGRTCSRKCGSQLAYKEGRKPLPNPPNSWGPGNTNWKGGIKWAGEYKMIRVPPGTPGATRKGYMMEHRYVMQQALGRPLEKWEEVHHRNGVKTDNRVENLEVVTHARHRGQVTCPSCQHTFYVH